MPKGVKKGGAQDKRALRSTYKPEYDEQAYSLSLLGLTLEELSVFFKVSDRTIDNWMINKPTFHDAVKRGAVIADANVAVGLYKRATGYEYTEEKVLASSGCLFREKVTVHIPPDPRASMLWLANRQHSRWLIDPTKKQTQEEVDEKVVSEVTLPSDPIEASRAYQQFIKGE